MSGDLMMSSSGPLSDAYCAVTCSARGAARSTLFHPPGYSLWSLIGDLGAGTELTWKDHHGDEGLYVIDGELEVDGRCCGPGGAVIVESGAFTALRARTATRLMHFGPSSPEVPATGPFGAPTTAGHGVHVFPSEEYSEQLEGGDPPIVYSYFRDGSCPTCRIALFIVDARIAGDGYVAPSHLHSQDEIVHVLDGGLRFGHLVAGAGSSIAVPANRRYGFRALSGFRFINYRRDAATVTVHPGSEPLLETVNSITGAALAGRLT